MQRNRTGWMTMICFIAALTALLASVGLGSRHAAWSFSADVPSPILASMTAHPKGAVQAPTSSPSQGMPTVATPANGVPTPTVQGSVPKVVAPVSAPVAAPQTRPVGSNWPAIILGAVLVVGVILIILYFLTRNNEEEPTRYLP